MENKSDFLASFQNETAKETYSKCSYVPSNLHFMDYLRVVYIVNCVVNALFSPLAVFGNTVVFHAIMTTQNLQDPAHLLLAILALTDLTVGLIQQPLYVIYKAAEINRLANISCIAGLMTNMLAGVLPGMSFLIVTLVTVDRFLALHLHLRYKTIVTRSVIVKLISVSFALFLFVTSFYPWKPKVALFIAMTTIPICLIISTMSYFKIYRIVRKHQLAISSQTSSQPGNLETTTTNVKKYWKFVVSFSYVYFIMILCYLPYTLTLTTRSLLGITKEYKLALNVTSTFIFINSSLNPLVYCWKIKAVRRAVFKTLRSLTGTSIIEFQSSSEYNQSAERSANHR